MGEERLKIVPDNEVDSENEVEFRRHVGLWIQKLDTTKMEQAMFTGQALVFGKWAFMWEPNQFATELTTITSPLILSQRDLWSRNVSYEWVTTMKGMFDATSIVINQLRTSGCRTPTMLAENAPLTSLKLLWLLARQINHNSELFWTHMVKSAVPWQVRTKAVTKFSTELESEKEKQLREKRTVVDYVKMCNAVATSLSQTTDEIPVVRQVYTAPRLNEVSYQDEQTSKDKPFRDGRGRGRSVTRGRGQFERQPLGPDGTPWRKKRLY
jgi:hypothetical protein